MTDQTVEQLQAQADAAQRKLDAAKAAAAATAKAQATPRTPDVIMVDFMSLVAMRLGNRPDLKLLITELKAATHQEEPPATQ